jgi:diguanylate cyclase (GGDEF)-like protein
MKLVFDSLRNRLVSLFVISVLLVGAPTYLYIDSIYTQRSLTEKGVRLHALAESVSAMFSEGLRERQREISLLAESPFLKRDALSSEDFETILNSLKASYKHYSWIGLADADGIVRVATGGLLLNASVAQRPWFIHGLQGPFVGDLHEALLLSKLLPPQPDQSVIRFIDFAAPVITQDGTVRGVLAAHAHWDWARDVANVVLPANIREDEIDLFIVNREGIRIYPEGASLPERVPAHLMDNMAFDVEDWGDGALFGTSSYLIRDPIPGQSLGWRVIVRQPLTVMQQDVVVLKQALLGFKLFAVLLLIGLIWWFASRMSRPIEIIARFSRKVQQGNEGERLSITNSKAEVLEVRELIDAVGGMAKTLLERKHALEENNQGLERKVAEHTSELEILKRDAEMQARTDALTGLPNRRAFSEAAERLIQIAQRSQRPLSLIMMDIDFFKKVNDTWGHDAGDVVLIEVARLIADTVRISDMPARLGGEEFAILLPETDSAGAQELAEKLRLNIAAHVMHAGGATIKVTSSFGIVSVDAPDLDIDQMLQKSDAALYRAKNEGRNRICLA